MNIRNIKDCYKLVDDIPGKIFWVWVTAFMRIIPAFLFKNKFEIICYKNSLDIDILSEYTNIFCLENKKNGRRIGKLNTSSILEHPTTEKYLQYNPWSYLFIYKNSTKIQKIAKKFWLAIINNASITREKFENKKHFRSILKKIWIDPIPGKNIPLRKFIWMEYEDFTKEFGKRLVIQLPDILTWWGKWTIFINNNREFTIFIQQIFWWTYKNIKIHSINITKFVEGVSASIIWCTTKYGTFSSSIQTQLIDIPEAINTTKWSWLFCWHDRSFKHFSSVFQKQASIITQKLGTYMYEQWYKWIFWLDLIIDEKNKTMYVVECNSRYTWAFPMISLLDIQQWLPPMDTFHLLEHMNIPYTVNFEDIDKRYKYPKEWSHIILSNKKDKQVICKKNLLPWVYTYHNKKLIYQRPWLLYSDIKNNNEFIIIDGNPKQWEIIRAFSELSRFCHLLFPWKIALAPNKINTRTKNIITTIYNEFIW